MCSYSNSTAIAEVERERTRVSALPNDTRFPGVRKSRRRWSSSWRTVFRKRKRKEKNTNGIRTRKGCHSRGIVKKSRRTVRSHPKRKEKKIKGRIEWRNQGGGEIKKRKEKKERNGRTVKNLGIRRCDRVRLDDLQNPRKEKVCERKSARREGEGGNREEEQARGVGKLVGR